MKPHPLHVHPSRFIERGPSAGGAGAGRPAAPSAAVALLVVAAFVLACARVPSPAEMTVLTQAFKLSMDVYAQQKVAAQERFEEANRKRIAAIENNFKFKDPRTNEFIDGWKVAETDVHLLRERFDQTIKNADMLFAYTEKKAEQIQDSALQSRMFDVIKARKSTFLVGAQQSHNAISALEKLIVKGNDLIKAIEILGALNQVDAEGFAKLITEADQRIIEIDALVREGNVLLNSELIKADQK
jgi:hypothetical protein